jgi:hypothetical protein
MTQNSTFTKKVFDRLGEEGGGGWGVKVITRSAFPVKNFRNERKRHHQRL